MWIGQSIFRWRENRLSVVYDHPEAIPEKIKDRVRVLVRILLGWVDCIEPAQRVEGQICSRCREWFTNNCGEDTV